MNTLPKLILRKPCLLQEDLTKGLEKVKKIKNSRSVIARLERGEPGAWAEIDVASRIKEAGYYVEFSSPKAPALNPDLSAQIGAERINLETIYLQAPRGGRAQLTEGDRIKRAIDNKIRQLPKRQKGIIVIYSQGITLRDLSVQLAREAREKFLRHPHILAVIVIKDLTRGGGAPRVKEYSTHLLSKGAHRYTFIIKGRDTESPLLKTVEAVFLVLEQGEGLEA